MMAKEFFQYYAEHCGSSCNLIAGTKLVDSAVEPQKDLAAMYLLSEQFLGFLCL